MGKDINDILEKCPQYQGMLFCRGYIITSEKLENMNSYPFYNNWREVEYKYSTDKKKLNVYVHKWQSCSVFEEDGLSITIIGHAYNPINMQQRESDILKNCLDSYKDSEDAFFDKVSELTGIHLIMLRDRYKTIVLQDCCGIMPVFYGEIKNQLYLSSHSQLLADICGLEMAQEVRKYIGAPFYKVGITQLCGLETPFSELTMLSPNTYINLENMTVVRFYPRADIIPANQYTTSEIEQILKNSINLCIDKWKCSISLTGGVDSKMTLAAANEFYDKLAFFSYSSSKAEYKDVVAASEICQNLGLKHTIYDIPKNKSEIRDFDIIAKVMQHNQGYIRKEENPDALKRSYLANNADIEVEIRSNVSEVGRAFYYKKLGKKKFKYPLTPRNMSNLAKRNFFNRDILRYMDSAYHRFIKTTGFGQFPNGYDESDMFYWENRMPAWGALAIQSFDVSHKTTIIFNNRKLLELFLMFPLEERIMDKPQKTLIKNLNASLFKMNINNNNAMKERKRIFMERAFFELNSITLSNKFDPK